jgi:hypothetical protein
VTYTATVSPVPDGGTVQFRDGGFPIAGCTAQAVNTTTGVATCVQTYSALGTHAIISAYVGNTNFRPSTSAGVTHTVNAAASTTTVVTSSLNPSVASQQVTYTATVSPVPDGGTVLFRDGGSPIAGCTAQGVNTTTGQATCSVTYLVAGSHSITAVFGGTASYPTSTSAALTQVVNPTSTTTALVSSVNPSGVGQQVTFTATVSPVPDGGTMGFTDGGSPIAGCTAQAVNTTTGKATCSVTYAVAGSHSIAAAYAGTASYIASLSPTLVQTVQ